MKYFLTVPANEKSLPVALDFLQSHFNEESKSYNQLCVASDEILSNIVRYAYNCGKGEISLTVDCLPDKTVVEFSDSGMPYNPLLKEDADVNASLEDRQIGGLGIFIVKKIMDSVTYNRVGDKNVLTIEKSL